MADDLPVFIAALAAGGFVSFSVAAWSAIRILSRRVIGDDGAAQPSEVTIQVKYPNGRRENLPVPHPQDRQTANALRALRHVG